MEGHREPVYRFLVATAGPQDADDCFQETFISAFRAYPQVKDPERLRSWIFSIAYRKALDSHRNYSRRRFPGKAAGASASEDAWRDPVLWKEVNDLPKQQRAAVLLRYVSDLAYRDIAQAIGCSEEAARQNVRAGLQKLRERWTK
jgi:RNA polymerase sigma factor (sigma-70 family)